MTKMTADLLKLSKLEATDKKPLSMARVCGELLKLMPSAVLIPLQESLTASVPPTSALDAQHKPFPVNAPTFARESRYHNGIIASTKNHIGIHDELEVMSSMAKPKKMTIQGSDGLIYTFLAKKDDLRKDSRLMDFDAILNKLLKSDTDSRRRQLRTSFVITSDFLNAHVLPPDIRTYGVVSLNEEAGLIQWVPNTAPIRPILLRLYDRQGIQSWVRSSLRCTLDRPCLLGETRTTQYDRPSTRSRRLRNTMRPPRYFPTKSYHSKCQRPVDKQQDI